jgi:hypothetical protein
MMFACPPISFSPWVHWDDREQLLDEQQFMGVYLWAHFHRKPNQTMVTSEVALPKELVYIGESKNLNARPLHGLGHQRLVHYRNTFPP